MIIALLFEQIYRESSLNNRLSYLNNFKISSEYNAKSGFNLGIFLFTINDAVASYTQKITGAKDTPPDSHESHWNLINNLPAIGEDLVTAVEASKNSTDVFDVKGVMNQKNNEIMKLFKGSFT